MNWLNNLKARALKWWTNHGTKILGAVISIAGQVQAALAAGAAGELSQTARIVNVVAGVTFTTLGIGVIRRGFTNSVAAEPPPP